MPLRLLLAAMLLAYLTAARAQTPQPVRLDPVAAAALAKAQGKPAFQPCAGNDAGTVTIGALTGQSNDASLDTVFLCFGDEVLIDHNGDQRLDGDPDEATPAGVGYVWYECRPGAEGPTRIAVEADACLIDNPSPDPEVADFFLTTAGRLDGDQAFRNTGAVQTLFGGDPRGRHRRSGPRVVRAGHLRRPRRRHRQVRGRRRVRVREHGRRLRRGLPQRGQGHEPRRHRLRRLLRIERGPAGVRRPRALPRERRQR